MGLHIANQVVDAKERLLSSALVLGLREKGLSMAFHIANQVVDDKARLLSRALGLGLVETIEKALDEALASRGLALSEPAPTGLGTADELELIIRRDLVTFKRLREERTGRKSSTGYTPGEIKKHGVVKTLELAMRGTSGLKFLIDHDALDLTFEHWVSHPRFRHLFKPEVVATAEQTLHEARLIIASRKQHSN